MEFQLTEDGVPTVLISSGNYVSIGLKMLPSISRIVFVFPCLLAGGVFYPLVSKPWSGKRFSNWRGMIYRKPRTILLSLQSRIWLTGTGRQQCVLCSNPLLSIGEGFNRLAHRGVGKGVGKKKKMNFRNEFIISLHNSSSKRSRNIFSSSSNIPWPTVMMKDLL